MGGTDPIEPFETFETDETRAAAELARAAAVRAERPDWLVGADAGVEAERERREREASAPLEAPTLRRPTAPLDERAPARPAAAPVRLVQAAPPQQGPHPAPEKAVAWTAAASSLPTLRVLAEGTPATKAAAGASSSADARLGPRAPLAAVPRRTAAAPMLGEDEDGGFPDDAGAAPAPRAASAPPEATRAPRSAPPREAWWLVALDALRSEPKVQILAGLAVVLVALLVFWPHGERSVALGELRRHPQGWDGRVVRVRGQVGEIFSVGGGYAFYLHQGRDTLVVFTRSRTPRARDRISVSGSITTGWLDGVPRQALFEDAAP